MHIITSNDASNVDNLCEGAYKLSFYSIKVGNSCMFLQKKNGFLTEDPHEARHDEARHTSEEAPHAPSEASSSSSSFLKTV